MRLTKSSTCCAVSTKPDSARPKATGDAERLQRAGLDGNELEAGLRELQDVLSQAPELDYRRTIKRPGIAAG